MFGIIPDDKFPEQHVFSLVTLKAKCAIVN